MLHVEDRMITKLRVMKAPEEFEVKTEGRDSEE